MSRQETSGREKLNPFKIKGKKHTFIDENLQIQLPGQEHHHSSYTPIYSHYLGGVNAHHPYLESSSTEQQLKTLSKEAEQVYMNWKNLQNQLVSEMKKAT